MRFSLAVLAIAATVGSGREALADDPPAPESQVLFETGRKAMKSGAYAEALPSFRRSYEIEPKLGTILNISLCEEKLGQLLRADEHLRHFLESVPFDDDRRTLAQRHLDEVQQRMPHLWIKLGEAASAQIVVQLDGVTISRTDLDSAVSIDPGQHTLTLTGITGSARATTFQVKERQEMVQNIDWEERRAALPEPPPVPVVSSATVPPLPPVQPQKAKTSVPGIVFMATGAGTTVVATWSVFEVLWNKRLMDQHCGPNGCDGVAHEAASDGKKWSTLATVLTVASVASLAAGAYFLLSPSATDKPPRSTTRTGLDVRLGSSGAALAVSGSF
jgi:hypothetical protein